MAYGLKYQAGFGARSGIYGHLYIDEVDYVGTVTDLTLRKENLDDFKLEHKFENWENPILGLAVSFTIVNNFDDFYALLPLMTAQERQYRVRIEIEGPSAYVRSLFEGFLNVDAIHQKYLKRKSISFVASSYLTKQKHFTTNMVDTVQDVYFINLIDSILRDIGEYNIRVNISLYQLTVWGMDPLSTPLNNNGINTEVFWQDNVTRKTNLEILKSILVAYNSYLYWQDGYWYIERYGDFWNSNPTYIEYVTGNTYDYDTLGTQISIPRSTTDLQSLVFVDQSQTLHISPGYRRLLLNLGNNKLILNLVSTPLVVVNIPDVPSADLDDPVPALRTWEKDPLFTWSDAVFGNIEDCIKRTPASIPDDSSPTPSEYRYKGLYARFKVYVKDIDTKLNITWKYGVQSDDDDHFLLGALNSEMNWWLKDVSRDKYFNNDEKQWEDRDGGGNPYYNIEDVSGETYDQNNQTVQIGVNANLGEATNYPDSDFGYVLDLVLCIGIPRQKYTPLEVDFLAAEYFGDVQATVNTNNLESNEIKAESAEGLFLNEKKIDFDLLDLENINYTNGILGGQDLDGRTSLWTEDGITQKKLSDWFLETKFKLYSESRQKIFGSIHKIGVLKVFDMYTDSGQTGKQFVLVGYIYYPTEDVYGIRLYEIDTITEIILNQI